MGKSSPSPEQLMKSLAEKQRIVAEAVGELKAELAPSALTRRAKTEASAKVKAATLDEAGKPKPSLLVAAAGVLALIATLITVRAARRGK
ncbi:MAG: hypothetical protein LBR27_08660 [Bifidobacteriaceae bacterium]|jgi:hypothetical protein|nr:hypothetical protein [Bifidobacteriaceae bacterium]